MWLLRGDLDRFNGSTRTSGEQSTRTADADVVFTIRIGFEYYLLPETWWVVVPPPLYHCLSEIRIGGHLGHPL